jgi:hypothetical protein
VSLPNKPLDNIVEANITRESGDPLRELGAAMVFVLSADKKPLDMCSEARARKLLDSGKAAVFRTYPFIIIMKDVWRHSVNVRPYRLKIDPGSKITGMAILDDRGKVVFALHLHLRGSGAVAEAERRDTEGRALITGHLPKGKASYRLLPHTE